MEITQYSIVLVDLNNGHGSVIRRTRPCVVVSPNEMNRYLLTVVIAPMTTTARHYPTRVKVRHNKRNGWIAADQLTSIDRTWIHKKLGSLTQNEIRKLKRVIKETYVD